MYINFKEICCGDYITIGENENIEFKEYKLKPQQIGEYVVGALNMDIKNETKKNLYGNRR